MRDRIEDLGVIQEKLRVFLDMDCAWQDCQSKHTVDRFIEKYSDPEKLEDLHNELRNLQENLYEIYAVSMGRHYDNDA